VKDIDHAPSTNANPAELADTELEQVAAGKPFGFKAIGFGVGVKAVKGLVW